MEDIYPEVKVLCLPGMEDLWEPTLSLFHKVAYSIQEVPSWGDYMCNMIDIANEVFQFVRSYFVEARGALMYHFQDVFFSLSVRIPVESVFGCTIPDKFCIPQVGLLLRACRARGVHLVAEVHRDASA